MIGNTSSMSHALCPYGQPGDMLWVKEAWSTPHGFCHLRPADLPEGTKVIYRADYDLPVMGVCPWRPSLFMRRWMSRVTLEITAIRVERLNDISEADSIAEGVTALADQSGTNKYTVSIDSVSLNAPTAKEVYAMLWEFINGPGSWALNPWVWVIEFRRVEGGA
jgi:hypothetical protein